MEEGRGRERWVPAGWVVAAWYTYVYSSTLQDHDQGIRALPVRVSHTYSMAIGGNAGYWQTGSCTMVLSRTTLSSSETKANNSNAHLACFKCAEYFEPDHFYRCTETNRCFILYTWFPKPHSGFNKLPNGTRITKLVINLDRQTDIHTMLFVGGGGDCSALPCRKPSSTIKCIFYREMDFRIYPGRV